MAGGGEKIKPLGGAREGGLSKVITEKTDDLILCVSDIIKSFVDAAEIHNEINAT